MPVLVENFIPVTIAVSWTLIHVFQQSSIWLIIYLFLEFSLPGIGTRLQKLAHGLMWRLFSRLFVRQAGGGRRGYPQACRDSLQGNEVGAHINFLPEHSCGCLYPFS